VQFPGDAHDTEVNASEGESFWIPLANTAGRASAHTPFVDVMVKATLLLFLFKKFPTAVQFPGDAHDTELNCALGKLFWVSEANSAGCASAHTPFVIVMVNASEASDIFLNLPTAVQFPGDAHDTELKSAIREIGWTPSANTAGRASSHAPFVDVMVNASRELSRVLKYPTAVQFPGDAHDTELNCARGESFWTPSANTAGRAMSHTPFVDVMVNASWLLPLFK
jgi:hypothetical protein